MSVLVHSIHVGSVLNQRRNRLQALLLVLGQYNCTALNILSEQMHQLGESTFSCILHKKCYERKSLLLFKIKQYFGV